MIEQRPLGRTGLRVGAIGLGAWQLAPSADWPEGPDAAEAVRIVDTALDAGVTLIDTAPGYARGESERTIGRALRGRPRDGLVVCTKFGHTPEGTTDWRPEAIRPSVEASARRMGLDRIDVVLLHNPPADILAGRGGHDEALEDLRRAGRIRAYGASVDTAAEVDVLLSRTGPEVLEVRLSALYQEPWEAVGRARERGLGVIVKVPLESGWLAGRYGPDSVFAGVRKRWSRDEVAERARLVAELRDLLPPGTPLPEGALRFLLGYDAVSTVIPGTRSVAHLEASLRAACARLPATVQAAIRAWYAARLGPTPLAW